ncbi:hypothetical protein LC040_18530 [Bacillus tianshenii]|nr:hypothetical protein LC040_18530 [Bacillus tianshenii]
MNATFVEQMVDQITEDIYADFPDLLDKYGEAGKDKCRDDNQHHFRQLHTAYKLRNDQIFVDYALWLDGILTSRGMKTTLLIDNFVRIEKVLQETEHTEETDSYLRLLKKANEALAAKAE